MSYPPPAGSDPYAQQPDPYAQQPNPYAPPVADPYGQQPNPYAPPAPESPVTPGSPAAPYAQPYAQPYGQPYAQPYAPQGETNGLAIASMVLAIVSTFTCGVFFALPAAIMGHVALKKVRATGQQGEGMAKAGIIIGWIITGLSVLLLLCWGGLLIADLSSRS